MSNHTYTVQFADRMPAAQWFNLGEVPAYSNNRTNVFIDPNWTSNRFYRAATPRQP